MPIPATRRLLLLALLIGCFMVGGEAHAATRTWDGGGGDNNWSTCANWSSDTCPTSSDAAVFDGTSTKDATIDASFTGSLQSFTVNSGYSGTITQSRSLTTGTVTLSAGTFATGSQTVDVNGSLVVSGGTLTGTSGTTTVSQNITYSSGTISGTKVLSPDGSANGLSGTFTCSGTFPWNVVYAKTTPISTNTLAVASGCAINIVGITSTNAGITNSGTIDFTGVATTTLANLTNSGTITGVTNVLLIGSFNNSGTMTASGSQFWVYGSFVSSGTLNYSGTVNFTGTGNGVSGTLTCTGTFPWDVTFSKGSINSDSILTIVSGCSVNITSVTTTSGSINNQGSIDFSGVSTSTISNLTNSGTITDVTNLSLAGSLNNSGTLTVTGSNFSLNYNFVNTGTINYSGSITFFGTGNNVNSTLTCSGTFPWNITFSKTSVNTDNSLTVSSGCSATISSITTTSGSIVNNGSLSFSGVATTTISNLTNTGTITNITNLALGGSLNNSGTMTVSGSNLWLNYNFTSSGTLNFSGPVTFTGSGNGYNGTLTCTGTFPWDVWLAKASGATESNLTISSGCTATIARITTTSAGLIVNGTANFSGISTATLNSLTNTGTITGVTNLVTSYFTNSGSFSMTGPNWTVYRNFTNSGTITYDGVLTISSTHMTDTGTVTCGTLPATLDLQINKPHAAFVLGSNCTVNDLIFTSGTFSNPASSRTLTVTGNITRSGASQTFGGSNLSVVLGGSSQSLTGSMTIYNLTKTTAGSLSVQAGSTLTVTNNLTLQGTSGNLVGFTSTSTGSTFAMSVGGTADLDYLQVQDVNSSTAITCTDCTNSGNNTNFTFTSTNATPSVSTLGPTGFVNGSSGNDATPTLTFTTADTDADQVRYQLQLDDSSDFSSAVVDFTSALAAPGSTSFTVGQAAGGGTYAVGAEGQTLTDTSYYWRVRVSDDNFATSSYATANSGSIAFVIDTVAPSVNSVATTSVSATTIEVETTAAAGASTYTFNESVTTESSGAGAGTTWTHPSLTPNTEYSYTVTATDAAGNSATSAALPVYTRANPPSALVVNADSSTAVTGTWNANSNPGGTEYFAENVEAGTNSGWITATTWQSTGLTGNTEYTIRVKARNADGIETSTVEDSVTTPDTTVPVITLTGSAAMTLQVGETYDEPGATALDDVDGDITADIVITGSVDTSAVGVYTRYYNVSDASGNDAVEATRTVTVVPAQAPRYIGITVSGCRDREALNFDRSATRHDPSKCRYADDDEDEEEDEVEEETEEAARPSFALERRILQNLALLEKARSEGLPLPSFILTVLGATPTPTFTEDLTVGSTGESVRMLQTYLNTHGFTVAASGPGSPGQETLLFGAGTQAALRAFQTAKGISPATGYFGPLTRAHVLAHP